MRSWLLCSTGGSLFGAACVIALIGGATPSRGTVPIPEAVAARTLGQSSTAPAQPPSLGRPKLAEVPIALRLPAIAVNAPIIPVAELPDGSLAVPSNPHVLGWWYQSARPDSPVGTVVVIGHVDTARDGPGALFRLSKIQPGQRLALDTSTGQRQYVIRAVRSYPKTELPIRQVFDNTGQPRLVLITCGGSFDSQTRQYANNIVVYAVPA